MDRMIFPEKRTTTRGEAMKTQRDKTTETLPLHGIHDNRVDIDD